MMKSKHEPSVYASPCLSFIDLQFEQEFMQGSTNVNGDGTDVGYETDWDDEVNVGNNGDIVLP